MKHLLLLCAIALVGTSCKYNRIASLNMVSTRNVDPEKPGVMLLRGVEAAVKTKHNNAMNEAIDKACATHPGGEYMMNCVVYLRTGGRKLKVSGDVYGTPVQEGLANPVQTGGIELAMGDTVVWKQAGTMRTGTIVGMRPSTAMVEFDKKDMRGNLVKDLRELPLKDLTKVVR